MQKLFCVFLQPLPFPKLNCFRNYGNDTIDCYPLLEGGIKKILIVGEEKFKELRKDFQAFLQGLRGGRPQRSSLSRATRGQVLRSQQPLVTSDSKIESKGLLRRYQDYEPTNAIYVNECDYRRWCRVAEWFNQFNPDAEIFQRPLSMQ